MALIRSLAFHALFYVAFAVMAVVALPALVNPAWTLATAKVWARLNIWLVRHVAGLKLEIRGRENIPTGGAIVAAKHQSAFETFAIAPFVPAFAFILKRELMWLPLFGWYLARAGMIPVDRGARSAALRAMTVHAREAVARGRQIVIFPEGTRREVGAELAYKWGVAHLYAELGVPCVPVALNTGLFWPRRRLRLHPGAAIIEFLRPIEPGLPPELFLQRLKSEIETATARLIAEGRRALAASTPPVAREVDPERL